MIGGMISTLGEFLQERAKIFSDRFGLRPPHLIEEEIEVEGNGGSFLGGAFDDESGGNGGSRIGVGIFGGEDVRQFGV